MSGMFFETSPAMAVLGEATDNTCTESYCVSCVMCSRIIPNELLKSHIDTSYCEMYFSITCITNKSNIYQGITGFLTSLKCSNHVNKYVSASQIRLWMDMGLVAPRAHKQKIVGIFASDRGMYDKELWFTHPKFEALITRASVADRRALAYAMVHKDRDSIEYELSRLMLQASVEDY